MTSLDDQYFDWLLTNLHSGGVAESVEELCRLLHEFEFHRRVGNDVNRAVDGAGLREDFLHSCRTRVSQARADEFLDAECTWLEMLVALSAALDFLYDGGVEGRFLELTGNLGLNVIFTTTQQLRDRVQDAVYLVDNNHFDYLGQGGIFPLTKDCHRDQRLVEIWDQQAAYFRERLEGVLWTSTS